MKICPRCQTTYADDNLNYCLADGSVLTSSTNDDQTVLVNETRLTQQPLGGQYQQATQPGSYSPQAYSSLQPQKSSKTWIWVVLILGAVIVVCGGGFAGLVFLGLQAEKEKAISVPQDIPKDQPIRSNKATNSTAPPTNASNSTSNSTSDRTDLETIDLSDWLQDSQLYGVTEFKDGEFFMSSKKKGFYYVLVAPSEYTTDSSDTRVTLRNVDNARSSLGYGLVFHSDPTPLQQDYAFLIDTKRQKYRIVHHEPQDEEPIVNWTTSDSIRSGDEENTLEVRDRDKTIDLYINGTMVTSIRNVYGYSNGVPGLYSGDGVKIAFRDLEIRK